MIRVRKSPLFSKQNFLRGFSTDSTSSLIKSHKNVFTGSEEQKLLFDCGVHLGHTELTMHKSMSGYIYGKRHGRLIFDLRKSIVALTRATRFINHVVSAKGRVMFVATRPDVSKLLYPLMPNNPYSIFVGHKWLGGTITNWDRLMAVAKLHCEPAWESFYIEEFEEQQAEKESEEDKHTMQQELMLQLVKYLHENLSLPKQRRFLRTLSPYITLLRWKRIIEEKKDYHGDFFKTNEAQTGFKLPEGIDIQERPSCIVLFHGAESDVPIKEGWIAGIPVVSISDSDCDISTVQYPIPANDDSLRAQYLFGRTLTSGIANIEI